MIKHAIVAALLVAPLPALAQTDMNMMARNAAANELGVLEFCHSNGSIDDSAIAAQKQVVARMPAGGPTDAAEEAGKNGDLLSPNGTKTSISEMADKGSTTVAAMCIQMATNVRAAVANNPAMSMTPGQMPAMPGGMPTLPPGTTMPTMPGAPPMVPPAGH
jgi:hypothetical protein